MPEEQIISPASIESSQSMGWIQLAGDFTVPDRVQVESILSGEAFGTIAGVDQLSWDEVYFEDAYPTLYVSVGEAGTFQDAVLVEGTDLGSQSYSIPVSSSLDGVLDIQGIGTWNEFRKMTLKMRVRGTSFADLQANIGALTRTVTQDGGWVFAFKRHPNSSAYEQYYMARCSPFKVPFTRQQSTHLFADLEIPLIVASAPEQFDDSDAVTIVNTYVSPASPQNATFPPSYQRDAAVPDPVLRGGLWWFKIPTGESTDQRIYYGSSDGVTGVPLPLIGGQDYKVSFSVWPYNFDGYFSCWVWLYQSDYDPASTTHYVIYEHTGSWVSSKALTRSGTFTAPQDAAFAQIRFNVHDTSTSGTIRFRSVAMGVHY